MPLYDELNSLDDLQALVDADERESDILEYKTARKRLESKDRDEAAKDISAFANASGGLLIYGIATDAKDKTKPTALDPIEPWNVNYLLHTIPAAIRHPIVGIRHKTFPVGGTPAALLFDVPESPLAPHQVAGECRYYRRQGVESVPMGHDLVELYFGRRMQAKLEPRITYTETDPGSDSRASCTLKLILLNAGGQIGRDVLTRITVQPNRVARFSVQAVHIAEKELREEGQIVSLNHETQLYYPGVAQDVITFTFSVHEKTAGPEKPLLFLDVYAAGSRPYRYNFFRTFQKHGEWKLDWEAAGLPAVAV